jgi:hypothetical protein
LNFTPVCHQLAKLLPGAGITGFVEVDLLRVAATDTYRTSAGMKLLTIQEQTHEISRKTE